MTHRIEAGQEYTSCNPLDSIRIRVVGKPFPGVTGRRLVDIATVNARGREVRRRSIFIGSLHESDVTQAGRPRLTGYVLVQAPIAEGSAER